MLISIRNRFLLTLLLLLTVNLQSFADGGEGNTPVEFHDWRIAANVYTGFVMNHHNNMRILSEQHSFAGELSILKRTKGDEGWHAFFNYPEYGLSFMMMDLGSPTYIGKAYGLYPFINFYLFNNASRLNLAVKAGGGAAYIEKIFDRHTNYKNVAIGSHINAFLNLQLNGSLRVSDRISASAGVGLSHFSNGTFKKPNAGVNAITFNAGGSYSFGNKGSLKPKEAPAALFPNSWSYRLYLSGGVKEISPIGGDKYLATGLSLEVSKRHLPFTRFGGTLDVFYDFSDYQSLQNAGEDVNRLQMLKTGVTAGYELVFGKVSANLQAGVYLYTRNKEYGSLYQRLALRYAVSEKINIHFGLKSLQGQADYIEVGCGYKLR